MHKLPHKGMYGKPLKSQKEAKRWKEHFRAVPNYPEPTITHDISKEPVHTLEINEEEFTAA